VLERVSNLVKKTEGLSISLTGNDPYYLRELGMEIPKFVEGYLLKPSDFLLIDPKGEDIGIDDVREISRFFSYPPEYGTKKYVLLFDIDKMTQQAANAFLKTLEEPPSYGVIITTTTRWYYLLPTIRSRLIRFSFNPPPVEGEYEPWVKIAADHDWRTRKELSNYKEEVKKVKDASIQELLKMERNDSKVLLSHLAAFEILERISSSTLSEAIEILDLVPSKLSGKDFFRFNTHLSRVALWLLESENGNFQFMENIKFFDSIARAKTANFNNSLTLFNIALRYREMMRRDATWR
jgi:DNA polymerase-3 subunit gamma/tau